MWTYSGDPSANDRDQVRFLVGDTDTADQQVTDAEIAFALTQHANERLAAALIARAIAAKYARRADKSVGDLSISYSQLQEHYAALATDLESRGGLLAGIPYAGGISKDDAETVEDDTDRVEPMFTIGMHDHPEGVTNNAEDEIP